GVLRVADWHVVGTADVAVMSYDIDEEHDYYGQHLRTRFHAPPPSPAARSRASSWTTTPAPTR
ncbi:MAG TPA: hypothetical protein VFR37_14635, partial [Longimicrobium sp.]|nr:hypothetical protein [Longimicrobium sp.]